mmetsp:Transcript_32806/g.74989  ORF Transcript_32806/g.74989 Transcript_32806/m.74989 type:complete len:162 (+) Transcript_32806:46-531(+)
MVHSHGQRNRTRDMFSRPFRKHGLPTPHSYLQTYKLGEYVDIVTNGAIHKGMPHKFYHGRTGRVWNVTNRAIGVEIMKQVGGRIMAKRLHVRMEHIKKSKCRDGHLARIVSNDAARVATKADKNKYKSLKRSPAVGRPSHIVKSGGSPPETLHVLPYELLC